MAKRQKQASCSLLSIWTKRARNEDELDNSPPSGENESSVEQPEESTTSSPIIIKISLCLKLMQAACSAYCCSSDEKGFQPIDKHTLDIKNATEKKNFQPQWYKQFPWLTLCLTYKKVFRLYCRYATQDYCYLFSFSKMGEKAFTETGFQNWKKSTREVQNHMKVHMLT